MGKPLVRNLAVDEAQILSRDIRLGRPLVVTARVLNAGAFTVRQARVKLALTCGGQSYEEQATVSLAAGTRERVRFEINAQQPGLYQGYVEVEGDDARGQFKTPIVSSPALVNAMRGGRQRRNWCKGRCGPTLRWSASGNELCRRGTRRSCCRNSARAFLRRPKGPRRRRLREATRWGLGGTGPPGNGQGLGRVAAALVRRVR